MVERSKRIELRVTADELKKIHERMEEAGISSLTAYLVRMALHGYVIVMDLSDLKEILRLLQISGNNLNQYAKKANETGSIYNEDIEELKSEPKYIYQPFIAGKEYGVDTFFDLKSGKLVSLFIKEKLAMRAGETDKAISVHSQNVIDEVLKVQNIKGLYGPIDIDVFVSNDGEVYINEINPRFGGGYPHAYGCGVNFMNLILNNLNGNENQVSLDSYKEGIMMLKYNGLYFRDTND